MLAGRTEAARPISADIERFQGVACSDRSSEQEKATHAAIGSMNGRKRATSTT